MGHGSAGRGARGREGRRGEARPSPAPHITAPTCGGIHVLPGRGAAQDIVHLLQLRVFPARHLRAAAGQRGPGRPRPPPHPHLSPFPLSPRPPLVPRHLPRHIAHVGAGGAGEAVAARPLLGHQHVAAGRAEQQHRGPRASRHPFRLSDGGGRGGAGARRGAGALPGGAGAAGAGPAALRPPPAGDAGGDRLAGGAGVRAGHDRAGLQGGRRDHAKYIWRTYHLTYAGEKLADDRKKLREYGIRNRDEVSFIKKLRK
uniref:SNRNP25 ubiquitin-like domain-containing protein n=1 Tax=Anas platyrhynchos platyrhynchos TaxID=8840 RepID=A0A493T9B8_ANAPP